MTDFHDNALAAEKMWMHALPKAGLLETASILHQIE
jgi:hypothetical protein